MHIVKERFLFLEMERWKNTKLIAKVEPRQGGYRKGILQLRGKKKQEDKVDRECSNGVR